MKTNKNIGQEDWELLAKELFDEPATPSKKTAIDETEKKKLGQLAQKIDLHFQLKKFDTAHAFSQVKTRTQNKQVTTSARIIPLRLLKIAAAVLLAMLVGASAYWVGQQQQNNEHMAEVVVDDSGLSQIELSDGTRVTLNRDTKINYPDKFGDDSREVSIEGEAFFEVTPNPNKPFIIHAGEATVSVLGTSFTVNAYPQDDRIEVIVASGKVQVSKQETIEDIILDPGDKGTFITSSKQLIKSQNADPNFLAWKTRTLVFNETSLSEVVKQLNKVYRVRIEIQDHELDNLLLNAHFEKESLDFILKVISTTHGLKVDTENGNYQLKKEA
ncbi:FecR family protein [Sunxiuqinia sp. sy24]|uniref:FecR family protein n=1 Tax=Sunxiuqinia sp. sy24 TaxID=3461495 RepID=UPI00404661D5